MQTKLSFQFAELLITEKTFSEQSALVSIVLSKFLHNNSLTNKEKKHLTNARDQFKVIAEQTKIWGENLYGDLIYEDYPRPSYMNRPIVDINNTLININDTIGNPNTCQDFVTRLQSCGDLVFNYETLRKIFSPKDKELAKTRRAAIDKILLSEKTNLSIESFLIAPFHRFTKWPLLFKDMKATLEKIPADEQVGNHTKALEAIESIIRKFVGQSVLLDTIKGQTDTKIAEEKQKDKSDLLEQFLDLFRKNMTESLYLGEAAQEYQDKVQEIFIKSFIDKQNSTTESNTLTNELMHSTVFWESLEKFNLSIFMAVSLPKPEQRKNFFSEWTILKNTRTTPPLWIITASSLLSDKQVNYALINYLKANHVQSIILINETAPQEIINSPCNYLIKHLKNYDITVEKVLSPLEAYLKSIDDNYKVGTLYEKYIQPLENAIENIRYTNNNSSLNDYKNRYFYEALLKAIECIEDSHGFGDNTPATLVLSMLKDSNSLMRLIEDEIEEVSEETYLKNATQNYEDNLESLTHAKENVKFPCTTLEKATKEEYLAEIQKNKNSEEIDFNILATRLVQYLEKYPSNNLGDIKKELSSNINSYSYLDPTLYNNFKKLYVAFNNKIAISKYNLADPKEPNLGQAYHLLMLEISPEFVLFINDSADDVIKIHSDAKLTHPLLTMDSQLVPHDDSMDHQGKNTLLLKMVINNRLEGVKYALKIGADADMTPFPKDKNKHYDYPTLLHIAHYSESAKLDRKTSRRILRELIYCGADTQVRNRFYGKNAIGFALEIIQSVSALKIVLNIPVANQNNIFNEIVQRYTVHGIEPVQQIETWKFTVNSKNWEESERGTKIMEYIEDNNIKEDSVFGMVLEYLLDPYLPNIIAKLTLDKSSQHYSG